VLQAFGLEASQLTVRLSWKRRSACEGGAGGEEFSGQGEKKTNSKFLYEEQWLVELNVEMVQLTFSLGFRDSTAALVLLLAACCKRDAKSQD
jgi:hypothetical protein